MAKKEKEVEEGAPAWVLTFGDMMSLLLCFFILLFSMSSIDPKKFADILGALQTILGAGASVETPPSEAKPKEMMRKLMNVMRVTPAEFGSTDDSSPGSKIKVETVREGLKITIGGKPLFDEGKYEILPEAMGVMRRLGDLVQGYRNKLRILGHTSGAPGDTLNVPRGRYALGYARAMSVLKYLEEVIGLHPARMEAATAAQFQPARSEEAGTPEAASQNRRVEVIVTEELIPWNRLN